MNVGSLFSGIGGIELGFERAGFKTEWFVEKDEYAQAVLRKNFPGTTIYGDITELDFSTVARVDILTGGFPCQDISTAGKRKGITGERSSLWKYYAKAISILRPKYAVIENVSALTLRGLDVVLSDIAKEGYDAEWFDLRASDVGALHKRERIFIVAYPRSSRYIHRESQELAAEGRKQTQPDSESDCSVANTDGIPTQISVQEDVRRSSEESSDDLVPGIFTHSWGERVQRFQQESLQREQGFSWCKNIRKIEDLKGRPDIPEPVIRRDFHGFSPKLYENRIRCLGNSVVPQVAELIAEAIKEAEMRERSG